MKCTIRVYDENDLNTTDFTVEEPHYWTRMINAEHISSITLERVKNYTYKDPDPAMKDMIRIRSFYIITIDWMFKEKETICAEYVEALFREFGYNV